MLERKIQKAQSFSQLRKILHIELSPRLSKAHYQKLIFALNTGLATPSFSHIPVEFGIRAQCREILCKTLTQKIAQCQTLEQLNVFVHDHKTELKALFPQMDLEGVQNALKRFMDNFDARPLPKQLGIQRKCLELGKHQIKELMCQKLAHPILFSKSWVVSVNQQLAIVSHPELNYVGLTLPVLVVSSETNVWLRIDPLSIRIEELNELHIDRKNLYKDLEQAIIIMMKEAKRLMPKPLNHRLYISMVEKLGTFYHPHWVISLQSFIDHQYGVCLQYSTFLAHVLGQYLSPFKDKFELNIFVGPSWEKNKKHMVCMLKFETQVFWLIDPYNFSKPIEITPNDLKVIQRLTKAYGCQFMNSLLGHYWGVKAPFPGAISTNVFKY